MASSLWSTVLNTTDLPRAARFWGDLLGARPHEGQTPDGDWLTLDLPGGGHLSLQAGTVRPVEADQPIHLDIMASESRAAEVARALEVGASEVEGWPYPDDADYTVLRDPDGHLFCVVDPAA